MKSVTDDLLIYASKACAAGTMHAHALHLELLLYFTRTEGLGGLWCEKSMWDESAPCEPALA